MERVLVVTYSQAGQTARAVQVVLTKLLEQRKASITQINLAEDARLRERYRFPWGFFEFIRALPSSVRANLSWEPEPPVRVEDCDVLVLGYPVWFLSPAAPISAFLKRLPEGSLAGKSVITVATSRNMWFEAQMTLRKLVESKGGTVVAHSALEDRGPTYATLVTTPLFFLTGKKGFESPAMVKLFPPFGVSEGDYTALGNWAERFWSGQEGVAPGSYKLKTSLALAEVVGKRIFRVLMVPWPVVEPLGRLVQNLHLLLAMMVTFVGLITLLPPLAIIGGLPPVRRWLTQRWERLLVSARRAPQQVLEPGQELKAMAPRT